MVGRDVGPELFFGRPAARPRVGRRERWPQAVPLRFGDEPQRDFGHEAAPPPVDDALDRVERKGARARGKRGRTEHRAEHLRDRAAVHVDLDDEVPVLAEHPVARPVEAVHVALEPVAQRDARDREPVPSVVQEPR